MGGPGSSRDVSETSSTRSQFNFTSDIAQNQGSAILQEKKISEFLDPKKAMRNGWECRDLPGVFDEVTPMVLINDLTLSRGEDIITAYDKTPLLIGQTVMRGYANHLEMSVCGVGDVRFDRFAVQIGDFESDLRIDRNLKAMIIEEGGGGNGVESYATAVFGYAYYSFLDANIRGKKGYMFILGDEGFYPYVSKAEIKQIYGVDVAEDVPAEQIFAKVQEKYHVFFIYIKKDAEQRKEGIDAEIRKRVLERGGMYDDTDVRASAIWPTCDDLDLHMVTPSGEEIYFRNPRSRCGGALDVDTNAGGCKTRKAVENIRYAKGKAPSGDFYVFVRNFAYHDPETKRGAVPFKVELFVDGRIEYFEGETPAGKTGSESDVVCFRFKRDAKRKKAEQEEANASVDPYAAYDDDKIIEQWRTVLPYENVLVIKTDPKAIADVMLGAIALTEERRTLDEYVQDLEDRRQTKPRQKEVRGALESLSLAGSKKDRPDGAKLPKKKKNK